MCSRTSSLTARGACHFAHNHPSGDLHPSDEDIKTQIRLVEAAKLLGIHVLDHLIVSRKGYFSFEGSGDWCLTVLAGGGTGWLQSNRFKMQSSRGQIVQSQARQSARRPCRKDSARRSE